MTDKLLDEFLEDFYRKIDSANTNFCGTFASRTALHGMGTADSVSVGPWPQSENKSRTKARNSESKRARHDFSQ
jgi:hypothetical protein